MPDTNNRQTLPPYVSYRTFRNFIESLQQGIPARIDRSYWGDRLSGSTGTQLMTALRFLGLIDGNGVPTTRIRQLESARGLQRTEVLKQISRGAYSFLIESSFNPETVTYAQLEEAFYNSYHVTGDVARKCIKFFIDLENDAGITLSPFLLKRSKKVSSKKKAHSTKDDARTKNNYPVSPQSDEVPGKATWPEMVLAKFPTFDPLWPDEIKAKWFEAFDTLLKKGWLSNIDK